MRIQRSYKPKRTSAKTWPALICIIVGLLILSGLLGRPFNAVSEKVAPTTNTIPFDNSKIYNDTNWTYDFSQLKDGPLSSNDWNFEAGSVISKYNEEAQIYTGRTENVRIENSTLVLEARKEDMLGYRYTSARINTKDYFSFTYGELEVEMMLPQGVGTWPATWLLPAGREYNPADYRVASEDKFSFAFNGEIDFAESIGSIPGENIPAAHSYNSLRQKPLYTPVHVMNPYTEFHRYGIIKKSNEIIFTLDGVPYASRKKKSNNPMDWPFDQPYYLIINLAIGGKWAGEKGIDDSSAPWQLKIKSIRYKYLSY